jgi:G3E family GTPase
MAPLPVTVLTGFLGAGKTSLLIRVLRQAHETRIAVVLNEIGLAGTEELAVDEAEYLELTQGCVCCVRASDLRAALEGLAARQDLDRVVIETTGVADPLALTWVLERPDMADLARLDAVVTVIDAANWQATRVDEWDAQVRAADLIILGKTDLHPPTPALLEALRALNPAARILDGADELPIAVLLDVEHRATAPAAAHAHHSGFAAVSIADAAEHDRDALEDLLEALPPEVFRAKGLVRTDEGWIAFHVVAGRLQVEPTAAPAHGESRVVFLGRRIEDAQLRKLYTSTER